MSQDKSNVRLAVEKILAGIAVHITDDMSEYHESLTKMNKALKKSGTFGARNVWLSIKNKGGLDFGDDEDLYPSPDKYKDIYDEHDLTNISAYELTDFGQAEALVYIFQHRLRYVIGLGWIIWNSRRWVRDEQSAYIQFGWISARLRLKSMNYRLEQADPDSNEAKSAMSAIKFASSRRNLSKVESALKSASTMQYFVTQANELDNDDFKIGVRNGVVNLVNGQLIDPDAKDLITKRTNINYFPDAPCPRWLQFLNEIFDGNQDLITYMKRSIGYMLTGDTREQCFFILYGHGANGKSVFTDILKKLLGDYATAVEFKTFTGKSSQVGDDLAPLRGVRLTVSAESNKGSRLDEGLIKQVTGGDEVRVRYLHGKYFTYKPQFKIILMTNHKPIIVGTDLGIWRRVKMIPFNQKFEGKKADKQLLTKLESELSGILAWAVGGVGEWAVHGLDMPDSVKEATEAYRQEMDTIGLFIEEMCVTGNREYRVTVKQAYREYADWCDDSGLHSLSKPNFGRSLIERGYEKYKSDGYFCWRGIGILMVND